eukprot:CAMPEP_0115022874 /NCGR_PEP_ID=MMETSP0216-20121206/31900_1 /TAXON_ID=223996 /ORGANISM="Protocruzia adherens, Strain Boccale" /LENGTH=43 /DNA_ID= /DNA_START= /DNA_END= /DNA_ORIENTATION=
METELEGNISSPFKEILEAAMRYVVKSELLREAADKLQTGLNA